MEQAATATRILGLLRDGPRTAQKLAAAVGLDVSSVRRHLEALQVRRWIAYDDVAQGPGRPKRHYRLTEAGWESFPRDYAFLLQAVLERMEGRAGREQVLAALADIAGDLARQVNAQQPQANRIGELESLYNRLGFEASIESGAQGLLLVQRNCPFLQAAKRDPEGMCECLDEGIMRTVLPEAKVTLRECMATGDARCKHEIQAATPRPKRRGRP